MPYYLAPLWDQDAKARAEARKREQVSAMKKAQEKDEGQGKVPKELREKLKKAKAAKGLLRDLEEQVRMFVKNFDGKGEETEKAELDSEDEMIVFVGRNGKMRDVPFSPKFRDSIDEEDLERERLVFESLEQDRGANFGYVFWRIFSFVEGRSSTDVLVVAGLFIPSQPTMVFAPGRSPLEIRLGGRHMLEYRKKRRGPLLLCYPVLCGAWCEE